MVSNGNSIGTIQCFLQQAAYPAPGEICLTSFCVSSRRIAFAVAVSGCLLVNGCSGGGAASGGSGSGGSGGGGTVASAPTVTSISPASIVVGSGAFSLTVNGSGFLASSVVEVNGTAEATTYVSASQLTAAIPAGQISNGASLAVAVMNGTVGSTGSAVSLEANNPAPTINSLAPSAATEGASSAVVTVVGSGFDPSTTIDVNGAARQTTYVSVAQAAVTLTSADLASVGSLSLTAVNPAPGGGTSAGVSLSVVAATLPQPIITSVLPTTLYVGSQNTFLSVMGTGFSAGSAITWNGTPLPTRALLGPNVVILTTTVPAADLTSAGTALITVETPGAVPPTSRAASVTISDAPVPTLTQLYPASVALGTGGSVRVNGTGFTAESTVSVNGTQVSSNYVTSGQLNATIPASFLMAPGNVSLTVTTPAPGGGTSAALPLTVYLPITVQDIVYNPVDGLLYGSEPSLGAGSSGNSVVGIDPVTGNVMKQIWVGSNPNKLALSTDGTQLFVGLDGAASVAQVNLTQGTVVSRFSLARDGNNTLKALSLAAVPGLPNSVAVATTSSGNPFGNEVAIYDSGAARANSWTNGGGPLTFGASASTLYTVSGNSVEELTVGSTGITSATALPSQSQLSLTGVQYDNGNLYLSTGQVLSASTGALLGTFYSSAGSAASGPMVSDSSLGRAYVATDSFGSNTGMLLAYDETSYNLLGSVAVNGVGEDGYGGSFERIVRWGQNGLAVNANPGPFTTQSQLFIFQSPLVKDLSSSPADLSVTLSAPATAVTGASATWQATVTNLGPNAAEGAMVSLTLDPSLTIGSVNASAGSCGTGTSFSCDLGAMANGATVTVTVTATPTQAGTLAGAASVTSVSYDPAGGNNQASTSTTVTGETYSVQPTITGISPNLVQAGGQDFTLTVNGTGFNAASTVNLGNDALATTFVNGTQLTASVTSAEIAHYGWAEITVSNPAPGGGVSPVVPLTIYALVNVPANSILFDPFSQNLYASVPGTSTTVTGNSVVAINPYSGAAGTPIAVGSGPNAMAETSDGNYLYVSVVGADSLAQVDLLHQSVAATIPLEYTQSGTSSSVSATYLAAMPGSDSTVAMVFTNVWNNFGIFDITGNTGAFRPNLSGIYAGTDPMFADANELYAADSENGSELYRYSVNANGVTQIDSTALNGYAGGFELEDGWLYGAGGGIANPATTPPSQIATLSLIDFYGSGTSPLGEGIAADPGLGKDFLMLENVAGTQAYGLARYDLTTYLPETVLNIPAAIANVSGNWTMLRWGQDGLALLTSEEDYTTDQMVSTLLLLRGPFVAPQELGTAAAATLGSSSAASLTHGSGNTLLTLTGTNFLPGVAVTWNGNYRTTTIVDASHVTVAIPASDLASAGTATLTATNPGAPASNQLTISVN